MFKKKVNFEDKIKDTRKRIIVCGDSIINGIDGSGLSSKQCQTSVRSFPGATSTDLIDYVKPLVNKRPDSLIIHIGTNDLTNTGNNTIENIKKLIHEARSINPNMEFALSEICTRDDKRSIQSKVQHLNSEIQKLCKDENFSLIKHDNIDRSCLSKKKLHLNRKGLSNLAKNLKDHIFSQ